MKRLAILGLACIVPLAGCGAYNEAHNHNAPAPGYDIRAHWVRVQSPGNYSTVIRSCVGHDGIYLTQSDYTGIFVLANDPVC